MQALLYPCKSQLFSTTCVAQGPDTPAALATEAASLCKKDQRCHADVTNMKRQLDALTAGA
jgi:hypothetical protein